MSTAVEQPKAGIPNMLKKYRETAVPKLMEAFRYKNVMEIPRLSKIVINMGVKEGQEDVKIVEHFGGELAQISGQKPVVILAKKSIAAFKLRKGSPIGLKVTLRGRRMYEFLDRLINIAMPRIRDFRGVSEKSFDGQGNYTFGIQEQSIFPEVKFDQIRRTKGMDVSLVTTAQTDKECHEFLKLMGFPFFRRTA